MIEDYNHFMTRDDEVTAKMRFEFATGIEMLYGSKYIKIITGKQQSKPKQGKPRGQAQAASRPRRVQPLKVAASRPRRFADAFAAGAGTAAGGVPRPGAIVT